MPDRSQRGLTLAEVIVVMAIASLVMVGLLSFYLSSQATWLDASSQAVTQREATLLVEAIASRARGAARAEVVDNPDEDHSLLQLLDHNDAQICLFRWEDGVVFIEDSTGTRPLVTSRVETFRMSKSDDLVQIESIEMVSATGQKVQISSVVSLNNRRRS